MLKNIKGILTTVLMDLTRFKICDFTVGGSNPCCCTEDEPHPNFARNLSSCNTQTAFRQSSEASNKVQRVNIST